MNYYFAYHSNENSEPFDFKGGYGFSESTKVEKVNIGDVVYIIQKLKGWSHFEFCGKFKIVGKYEDTLNFKNRPYRVKLEDLSKLDEALEIDEDVWSDLLPKSTYKYEWNNFQKHFCKQGSSLQRQLDKEVVNVLESFLHGSEHDNITSDISSINNDSDLSSTEKDILIKSRLGQGKFKSNVKRVWGTSGCVVTLCNIQELLIASHIKAWSDCSTSEERLDGANGLLLCAHIDKLFDNHLITFKPKSQGYALTVSTKLNTRELKGLGIHEGETVDFTHMSFEDKARFSNYMEHHNKIFDSKNVI